MPRSMAVPSSQSFQVTIIKNDSGCCSEQGVVKRVAQPRDENNDELPS